MATLGRKTAGREVRRLASALSDRLLHVEEQAFTAAEKEFAAGAVVAGRILQAGLASVTGEPAALGNRADVSQGLVEALDRTLRACEDVAGTLARRSAELAQESILAELTVCEKTLPGRYRGLAAQAAGNIDPDDVGDGQRGLFIVYAQDVSGTFRRNLPAQFQAADDAASLTARILSPDPVGERGFGGRGLWWQAWSGVKTGLRDCAITAANTVRVDAMRGFNTIGAGRG